MKEKSPVEDLCFESERLITRELCEADVVFLYQIYSDHEAMKYRGSEPMKSMDDAYRMMSNQSINENGLLKHRLGIWNKLDNALIGTLLLTIENKNNLECEIGFSFGKDHWRKGYGQEVLRMLEEKFRVNENVEQLKAWCVKENIASIRIFERAGFSRVEQNEYPGSDLFIKRVRDIQSF